MTERADEELTSLYIPLYFDEDVSVDIALLNTVTAEEMENQLRYM